MLPLTSFRRATEGKSVLEERLIRLEAELRDKREKIHELRGAKVRFGRRADRERDEAKKIDLLDEFAMADARLGDLEKEEAKLEEVILRNEDRLTQGAWCF